MALLYSPEYEKKVEYQLIQPDPNRLATPTDISTNDTVVLFSKVAGAETYSFFLDGVEVGSASLPGDGYLHYLFNERIDISDDTDITYNVSFNCNETTYSAIKVYGRDTAPGSTNKYAIYFDNTKVFEERADSDSLWLEQAYRAVVITSTPSSDLLTFLASAAEAQPEQLSFDLSTLQSWSEIEDGEHLLQLVARAQNKLSSFLSARIYFSKNEGFIKGHIYGPFLVERVVDGDTVVANIKGASMKIRMIGVDTPESVASAGTGKTNCQEGVDASNYTKAQLTGQNIYIEFDTDQYDKYNRYLCYIYRSRIQTISNMYNAELISEGYAEAKYFAPNGAHKTELEEVQAVARANNVRNWGTQFFPTILDAPVVTQNGSIITWPYHPYTGSYDIKFKKGSSIVYTDNFPQPVGGSQNSYDLATTISAQSLGTGTFKINVVSQPINSAHKKSSNSNTITYIAS